MQCDTVCSAQAPLQHMPACPAQGCHMAASPQKGARPGPHSLQCAGSLSAWASLPGPALAAATSPPFLIALHTQGIARLRFPSSGRAAAAPQQQQAQDLPCEGLNANSMLAGAFEVSARGQHAARAAGRLHAVTSEGDLLSVGLGPRFQGPCKARVPRVLWPRAEGAGVRVLSCASRPPARRVFQVCGQGL